MTPSKEIKSGAREVEDQDPPSCCTGKTNRLEGKTFTLKMGFALTVPSGSTVQIKTQ